MKYIHELNDSAGPCATPLSMLETACETVDRLRAELASVTAEREKARGAIQAVRLEVDGYIDGAPDRNAVSKLANAVSLIIDPPQM
jgi:hypothetical protein